jgi:hypothetical protein
MLAKHNFETKKTIECVKQTLENFKGGDIATSSSQKLPTALHVKTGERPTAPK